MKHEEYKLILSSNSPRRKELLAGLGLPFDVRLIDDIDESFPQDLNPLEVAAFISQKKAAAYKRTLHSQEVIITADTVVLCSGQILGKPRNEEDAHRMLRMLSGKVHQVVTGVTILSTEKEKTFSVVTDVTFKELTDEEITYYIHTYQPFDKAGAYGIQEWIGYVGVTQLQGSYFNVMGLPVQRIYEELKSYFPLMLRLK
ncbi:MAG: Maf-like protein [Prevotella sp.]|nr:Maf-like protein [Prevotella sp.]